MGAGAGLAAFVVVFGFVTFLVQCGGRATSGPVVVSGIAFFSMPYQVKVTRLPPGMSELQLRGLVEARLSAVNSALSTYQPDTELMRFNRAPIGRWVALGPLFAGALGTAIETSRATGGAYDPTVGPLVNLWGFGPGARPKRVPSAADIALARARVGFQLLDLETQPARARRRGPVALDLSSVGEGVAVDDLAALMKAHGINDYLISVAGVLYAAGKNHKGEPWRLAVERPDGTGQVERLLKLESGVVSTSGSYRNYFEEAGVRYSHTIDPATGRPIRHNGVSVTVVFPPDGANVATTADAWATALNVLGPKRGLRLAEVRGLAAYYIVRSGTEFRAEHSSAFAKYLSPNPAPASSASE